MQSGYNDIYTQYIYRRRKETAIQRFMNYLLADNYYFLKQKLVGIAFILVSVILPLALDGDVTASIIMFPLGMFLLVTKEHVYFNWWLCYNVE